MNKKAIIFDKDGTLLDFDAFWISVSEGAIRDTLTSFGREDISVSPFLTAIGVHDGKTDINSILCKGTYEEIGEKIYETLLEHGASADKEKTVSTVLEAYVRNVNKGDIKPTCPDLKDVLTTLKKKGIHLAIITTDTPKITERCLAGLGIYELFDMIYTDDGVITPKPSPMAAIDLFEKTGLCADDALMVGDTMTDVRFAKNSGMPVAILAPDAERKELFSPYADIIISKISDLLSIIE